MTRFIASVRQLGIHRSIAAAPVGSGLSLSQFRTRSTHACFLSKPGVAQSRPGRPRVHFARQLQGIGMTSSVERGLCARPVCLAMYATATTGGDGVGISAGDKVAKAKARLVKAERELDAAQEADPVDDKRVTKAELGVAMAEVGVAKAEWKAAPENEKAKAELGVAMAEVGVAKAEWKAAPESEKAKAELGVAMAELGVTKAEWKAAPENEKAKAELGIAKAELCIAEAKLGVAKAELGVAKAKWQAALGDEKVVFLSSVNTALKILETAQESVGTANMAYEKALNAPTATPQQDHVPFSVNAVWVQLQDARGTRSTPMKIAAPSQPAVFDIDAVMKGTKVVFRHSLQGVGEENLLVFDGEGGDALKPGTLVVDLKTGKDEESPLMVKAPPAVEFAVCTVDVDGNSERTQELFVSETQFQTFVKVRGLQHRGVVDGKERLLGHVKSLADAVEASKIEGTRLCLGLSFSGSVQTLEGTSKNHASGFEQQTTRTIAREVAEDESLHKLFGDVYLVNAGESVLFFKVGDRKNEKFLECDGLLRNTSKALLNEAKATPSLEDIKSLQQKAEKLSMILNPDNTHKFRSTPPEALEELQGVSEVVPLLSGYFFRQYIERAALKKRITCVRTDGNGYRLLGAEMMTRGVKGGTVVQMGT